MSSFKVTQDTESPRKVEIHNVDASFVKDSGRQLLREYSKFPDEEIEGHVETIVRYAFCQKRWILLTCI
jgi:hypothetical protein